MKWQFPLLQNDKRDQHAGVAMARPVAARRPLFVEYAKPVSESSLGKRSMHGAIALLHTGACI